MSITGFSGFPEEWPSRHDGHGWIAKDKTKDPAFVPRLRACNLYRSVKLLDAG
jgi:hypothetical protein